MSMASASFILYHVYPDDDGERVVKGRVQKMEKYGLLPDQTTSDGGNGKGE